MRLSDIDFEILENCTDPDRWGAGGDMDRLIYRNAEYYYKIWEKSYIEKTVAAVGNRFVPIRGLSLLHGFEVGLYNGDISSAFVEWIEDADGCIRGYVTKRGVCPKHIPGDFVDKVIKSSFDCGWTYSDLKSGNIVVADGFISLIDFDTHLVFLGQMDVEFEREKGCLRPHVNDRFRNAILSYLEGRVS